MTEQHNPAAESSRNMQAQEIARASTLVNPITGEVIDPEALDGAELADALLALREEIADRTAELAEFHDELQAELRHRLDAAGRTINTFGRYVVKVPTRREWDVEDTRAVVAELVAEGELTVGELGDLTTTTTKVNGAAAKALLGRLDPELRGRLEDCARWVPSGQRLKVEPR